MTAYTWIGATGDWNLASNWSPSSPAGPPTATDGATINATGPAYTVTIDTADVAQSLTESSASATVDDIGPLTLSAIFTLSAGTFILDNGGTLSGGTTEVTGGTFVCDGGTLSGVTYEGTLDLSESSASVYIANGTVVNDATGTGAGTINDTGYGGDLNFDNTQTFNNATIDLGSTSGYYSFLQENDLTGAGTVLTLGSNVTINESGSGYITDSGYAGDGIVNQGNINQTANGGTLVINDTSFTNSGTITAASSGGTLLIEATTFTNSGTLAVSNGDAVTIEATNFSNTGSITLASGGSLVLDGSYTLASLGTVTNSGGTVYIDGTLDNAGGALNGSSGLGQAVLDGGMVQGGTVTPSGLVLSTSGGTLDGVTYDGTLDLSGSDVYVNLAGGTVVNDAAGTGAGTINDTGYGGDLNFDNTQTFNNATIDLGSTSGYYSFLQENDLTGAGTVLTLGSNVTINESGSGYITDSGYAGDGIVNQGNINQTANGGTLVINDTSFTNSGTITAASSGGTLLIEATTFTNSGAITGPGTLQLAGGASTLSGGGAVNVANLAETGSGTSLTVSENLGYAGAFSQGAGSTLSISSADTLSLSGTASLSGTMSGLGTLAMAGGSDSINGGAIMSVANLSISGSGTSVTLGENLSYAGGFSEAAGDTFVLSGGYLLLNGAHDSFAGGTVNGSKFLYTEGTTAVSGLTIGGTVEWVNTKTVNQSGGAVTVGDASGDKAILWNAVKATYDILDNSGIGLGASTASYVGDAGLFEKTGGTGTSVIAPSFYEPGTGTVTVASGTLSLSGYVNTLAGAITGPGTFQLAGGASTLSGGGAVNVANLAETGSGTRLTVSENLGYAGAFSQGAGSKLSISSADTLSLSGTASLSGTMSGLGTLALAGGSDSINSGAVVSVANLSISGSGTSVTLGGNLSYAGMFSEAAGDTFVLSGGYLLLHGANDSFAGGTVDGSKFLYTEGTTTVSGLTIGGTVEWVNTKSVTQSGTVTIGDASGDKAFLDNTSTGTYDITANSGINRGSSTASYIKNAGLFEETGGTSTSTIAPAVTNTGTIEVTAATLDFEAAVTGTGTDTISGASTLEFDSAVSSSTTVGSQNIGFTGGGTLDLTDPTSFYGEVSGFAAGDTVELLGSWAFSGFSENSGGTLATLTLVNGTTTHAFDFVGDYAPGDFKITSGATSTITHT